MCIVAYVVSPVYASNMVLLDFGFYTYPGFEEKYLRVGLDISDTGGWQISFVDTDCDFSVVDGIYVVKESNLDHFFNRVNTINYEDGNVVKTVMLGGLEVMRWTSHSENMWLWSWNS